MTYRQKSLLKILRRSSGFLSSLNAVPKPEALKGYWTSNKCNFSTVHDYYNGREVRKRDIETFYYEIVIEFKNDNSEERIMYMDKKLRDSEIKRIDNLLGVER